MLITALAAAGTEAAAELWLDPSLVYLASYSCTVWRATLMPARHLGDRRAFFRTSSTARYR